MLRYAADVRTLSFVAFYYALLAVSYGVGTSRVGLVVFLVITLSLFSFFGAVITHNTIHAPVFRSRFLNKVFQVVLTCVYGHPVSMFVPGHNLSHHRFTETPRDLMRTTKLRWRSNLLNLLLFTSTVTPAVLRDNLRYARVQRRRRPAWFRQLIVEGAIMVGFFLVLLAIDWKSFLLYVAIPHQFAQWGIVAINFPQHDGCDASHPYNHSRNFTGGLLNWFTFNNGYHGIHHMRPALHWSLAPKVHAQELRPHIHPNLDHQSLFGWIWRTCIWPGRRLNYLGEPYVLPPAQDDESWIPTLLKRGDDIGQLGAEDVDASMSVTPWEQTEVPAAK